MGYVRANSPFWINEEWKTAKGFVECPYYYWQGLFTEDECKFIIENEGQYGIHKAVTGTEQYEIETNNPVDELAHLTKEEREKAYREIRDSEVGWIPYVQETSFIYDRIWDSAIKTNNDWNFDIRGFGEAIQYTTYDTNEGTEKHYGWHRDNGVPNNHRKVSFTVQLTKPEEYEGGEFELEEAGYLNVNGLGDCIMFPSFLKHRVKPVTSGCRRSLVVWISGPPIR